MHDCVTLWEAVAISVAVAVLLLTGVALYIFVAMRPRLRELQRKEKIADGVRGGKWVYCADGVVGCLLCGTVVDFDSDLPHVCPS